MDGFHECAAFRVERVCALPEPEAGLVRASQGFNGQLIRGGQERFLHLPVPRLGKLLGYVGGMEVLRLAHCLSLISAFAEGGIHLVVWGLPEAHRDVRRDDTGHSRAHPSTALNMPQIETTDMKPNRDTQNALHVFLMPPPQLPARGGRLRGVQAVRSRGCRRLPIARECAGVSPNLP